MVVKIGSSIISFSRFIHLHIIQNKDPVNRKAKYCIITAYNEVSVG